MNQPRYFSRYFKCKHDFTQVKTWFYCQVYCKKCGIDNKFVNDGISNLIKAIKRY